MKILSVNKDFDNKTYFYHGTSLDNIEPIFKELKLNVKYYDNEGIFLTDNYIDALNFGELVFAIKKENLNKHNIISDNTNDGIFCKNGIELNDDFIILLCSDDVRIIQVLIKNMIKSYI
jgi:hypothetical protein